VKVEGTVVGVEVWLDVGVGVEPPPPPPHEIKRNRTKTNIKFFMTIEI
jgi:hypothetical protein